MRDTPLRHSLQIITRKPVGKRDNKRGWVEYDPGFTPMKLLISCLLLSAAALAQNPVDAKVITFSRADAEHCRVITVAGKPLLESSYGGTSVAIGMPENKGNGEFSVYVSVYQIGIGAAHVNPKDFSALFPDPA